MIAGLMLVAALLPLVGAGLAKAGGKGFDNNMPRVWLAAQEGWRARANAAQSNLFESLPFFFAAVLFALHQQADPDRLASFMMAWIAARLAYVWFYVAGRGHLRSLVWLAALALNIALLFSA